MVEVSENLEGRFYELPYGAQALCTLVYGTDDWRYVLIHTAIREGSRERD